jgi:ubiquitin-protein ligase
LNPDKGWRASITVRQILVGVQVRGCNLGNRLSVLERCPCWLSPASASWSRLALQELLDEPNIEDPASRCYQTYKQNRKQYNE